MAKHYKIHPAIGFARVGNSPEIFAGPERPGTFALPEDGLYRDASGRLKRQAPRFSVFEYDDETPLEPPKPVAIGAGGPVRIEWSVHLVNKKAVWYSFDGVKGEGPAGYPAGHPLRNPDVKDPAERQRRLVIDPGLRRLTAQGSAAVHEIARGNGPDPASETWPQPLTGGRSIDALGTLAVDDQGRLSVGGGYGVSGTSGPLPADGSLHYANNNNWFDDTSDGPVNAVLVFGDGVEIEADPAWVIVAPPDYAPPIENIVTVHDLLFDLGLREFNLDQTIFDRGAGGFQAAFRPSFTRDIVPILRRALDYRWVIRQATSHESPPFDIGVLAAAPPAGEDPHDNLRREIFNRIRDPDNINGLTTRDMPRLRNDGTGDVPAGSMKFTVTRFQFFALKQWADGRFRADWTGSPPPPPTEITAEGLDRAAMDAACGGSFFPGMESGWTLRDPRIYVIPFEYRFRHASAGSDPNGLLAGDATKRMALPWQADFLKCGNNWWPAQRPNEVRVGSGASRRWDRPLNLAQGHVQLSKVWSELGIVAPDPASPGTYRESERQLPET